MKLNLDMTDEQRQTLTTWSMLGGAIAMTLFQTILLLVIRYSWPEPLQQQLAPEILKAVTEISFGCLVMMGIMVVAQATIAIGGKVKGKIGMAEFEADTEKDGPRHV